MKIRFTLAILFFIFFKGYTQSQVFLSENMGSPSATTSIGTNIFQNNGIITYSNGSQTNSADVRNTSPSSGYTNASAGGNVFFSASTGYYGFSIENINAADFSNLSIEFAYRKESATSHATFSVDYWDGNSWVILANNATDLFNELPNATAKWYVSKSLTFPSNAQINGLKIRFVKSGTVSIRIDDVKLSGVETAPTVITNLVSNITTSSVVYNGNVIATGGSSIIATGTVYAVTANNPQPILGGIGVTTISSSNPASGAGAFANPTTNVLLPNTQYSYVAYATKNTGKTGHGNVESFYTLANVPSIPTISEVRASSLKISIASDANPIYTNYAIFEENTGKYIQTDGTLGSSAFFQTASSWGNKKIIGLLPSNLYSFKIVAQNGSGQLTSFGLSITVTTLPLATITTNGDILSPLSTVYGTASSSNFFIVSGSNLTGNVSITAPLGFEISQTAGGATGYAGTQIVTQNSGVVSSTTIYVRLASNTGFGSYSGNIELVSIEDDITQNIPVAISTVAKKQVVILGLSIQDKQYDGRVNATINGIGTLDGLISQDMGLVTIESNSAIASFSDASIGINKLVTITGFLLNGSPSINYDLIQPSGFTASIKANALSDIIFNPSSSTSNNLNIDYKLYQGNSLTNTGSGDNGSIGVMGFYLRDGGSSLHDADNLGTELTQITFSVTNASNIRNARLFVGNSPRGNVVPVNGSTIVFSDLTNIIAPDDDQLAINLRVTFNTTVVDNQQMQFSIVSVASGNSSSSFALSDAGGATSSIAGDINRIEVIGDRMKFITQPPNNTIVWNSMIPHPSVEVIDSNGNRDSDFSDSISITSSGFLSDTPTVIVNNGLVTFDNLIHEIVGADLLLTANYLPFEPVNSIPFNISALIIPTFNQPEPICSGENIVSLPLTSLNGIVGTWSPEINNEVTTTYTFTPNDGQNAESTTISIDVVPLVTPSFDLPTSICSGSVIDNLPETSLEGITGVWSPQINNIQTTTYTFTPNTGQCASTVEITIDITPRITPTFDSISPICSSSYFELPIVSIEGITGIWSPEFDNSMTKTYLFTPDDTQCAITVEATIVITPSIVPLFDAVTPVCNGEALLPLPTISINGVTGTWSPEIDNTVTTEYTFTPDDIQCASIATLTITINPIVPLFDAIEPICSGGIINALPTTSINNITGSWSPDIDNSVTTTYTFTPDEGQCASETTLTVVVNQNSPIFENIEQICIGTDVNTLPTVSSNGVTGNWLLTVSESSNNIYTFTPAEEQCASTNATVSYTAVSNITPIFSPIPKVRYGGNMNELPTTSENGITGTWSPELNNKETTTYTFTPNYGQCAESTVLTVEVTPGDGVIVLPPPPLTPTGTSNEVGVTNGELSVSSSGAALYNIPISVPPGINGVVPQISLNYNSQSGVGQAGYGWNIGGLSMITRIPSTRFHDNIIDPVDFDSNDRFALDGQRLMLKSGSYGSSNSVYETENFSNVKVTFTGTFFKVEYPDGSTAYYGNSVDSKVGSLNYLLTYWENAQGVRISYSYSQTNNIAYINRIKYGSVGTNTPINEIQFIYKNRNKSEEQYIGGTRILDSRILSNIKVVGKGGGYGNYDLSHEIVMGYERLKSIRELNGNNNKSYNPTIFKYSDTELSTEINRFTKTNFVSDVWGWAVNGGEPYVGTNFKPSLLINGDFDGDGEQDFIYDNKLYTKVFDNTSNPQIDLIQLQQPNVKSRVPFKTLDSPVNGDYKIMNRDAWCIESETTTTTFTVYSKNLTSNTIVEEYSKSVNVKFKKTLTGDFNGDGLTDKLGITENPSSPTRLHFVNMDRRLSVPNSIKDLGTITTLQVKKEQTFMYIADVNGDGKSDIISVLGGNLNKVIVYSLDNENNLIQLWETPIPIVHNTFTYNTTDNNGNVIGGTSSVEKIFYESIYSGGQITQTYNYEPIVGDLNGDGKADMVFPGYERFALISTGVSFAKEGLPSSVPGRRILANNLATDFNSDNKLDILLFKVDAWIFSIGVLKREKQGVWSLGEHAYSLPQLPRTYHRWFYARWAVKPFMVRTSNVFNDKPQVLTFEVIPTTDNNNIGIDYDKVGFYTNMNTFSDSKLITNITIGNGAEEKIAYSSLKNGNNIYYSANQLEKYPNYDISNASNVKLVSKIEKQIESTFYKQQIYKYYGATSNAEGLGFLGFKSILNTNWHYDPSQVISTITISDIINRGTPIETFSVLGMASPTLRLQPTDDFINRTLYSYNNNNSVNPLLLNKVFKLRNTSTINHDKLMGIITEVTSEYDTYNLFKRTTLIHNNTSVNKTIVEEMSYDNLPSASPYFIGRPKSKKITTTLSPINDVSITEEEYLYNSSLLKEIKKRSTNSGQTTNYITESNDFDSYGNIIKKKFSTPNAADRALNFQYDTTTHRFITKKTDALGLVTDYTYDMLSGVVLTETAPSNSGYLIKTKYDYDTWFKTKKITNYLGNSTTVIITENYTNLSNGRSQKAITSNEGSEKKIILDHLGREIHKQTKDINGNWNVTSKSYDYLDRVIKMSQPYSLTGGTLGNFNVWNEIQYDLHGRIKQTNTLKSNTSDGKKIIFTYDGLTTTENDGQKQKVTVNDIFGNIASITESGVSVSQVNYSYFANNNLKTTTTSGSEITIEQDGWGRKKTLNDPSAGIYQYTYHPFGELKSEQVVGKGITNYGIDNYGRVISKSIVGTGPDTTNTLTTYTYSSTNVLTDKLFTDSSVNNYNIKYKFEYDNFKRLKKSTETRTSLTDVSKKFFEFQKEYMFDGFGRVEKEHFYAKDLKTNKLLDKWIKNTFKNGYKWQIYDMVTSTSTGIKLWQTNTVNAQGSLLTASLGNGVSTSNSYTVQGFPTLIKHDKASANIMSLNTVFEPKYGNLIGRNYTLIGNWNESLTYDEFDRLKTFKDLSSNQQQSYNSNGTISSNTIGNYAYTESGQPFTLTSITPTDQSSSSPVINYYINREQNISYNVFKSPVWITEDNRENIDFEYNSNNSRSVMYYGDTQVSKNARMMRKFYSEDGCMEIKRRTLGSSVINDFVIYIGGDGYSAPIIVKGDGTTKNYFYLHRDYQGTIVAITNNQGAVVEKRLFDVWGSLIKYNYGSNTLLPTSSTSMFIDRGYTGHEHLLGVGLINMNGRIYDPKLHRFLQPDNNIQDPFNTQNFNRYGYCMNNPTKYIDESGEFWGFAAGFLLSTYIHGAQATGNANPFKWNAGQWVNAVSSPVSSLASTFTTNFANNYIDNYNQSGLYELNQGSAEDHSYAYYALKSTWDDFESNYLNIKKQNNNPHPSYEKELIERFKKGKIDPWGKPNLTPEGAKELNKNVEGLQEIYVAGGKPKVRFDLRSDEYKGLTNFGDVNLDPRKIKNNMEYAALLFHEYRHAWQYASGNFYYWQDKYTYRFVENYQERDAYWFQIKMGAGSFFEGNSRFIDYRSITTGITYKKR